jgi:serine/threonine protein kinase/tetratricopeptide (TPR) repeat protein
MAMCRKCGAELDSDGTCALCLLAGGFDEEYPTVTSAGVAIDVEPSVALEYDSFGPYRILSVLGQGGMGSVYLAEQTHPLRRQVALKVVKLGLSTSEILSRFNYERQALALMDHPNIARVYDAGMSEKGRPYFVMEYVDGLPITVFCDQRRLNTKERLELFVHVCQALQHAHQKGIIHRDIKPSNVMVTEVDGLPAPKVIDFGIARATEQHAAGTAGFTQFGQFIGTPEYMSPEQADTVTGNIDTSSDVYSLGVLLYELLIGAAPFDAKMLREASMSEMLRIIREEEAVRMTVKLTRLGATIDEIAGRRRTDPGTLRRLVSGDINWIVMKAIEKDRQRRYPAASELAADIRRHLDDQPVSASPPSTLYRTRKFVRRHKLPVVAAAAVVAALLGGMVVASWQARIARQERAEAVAARALAEQRSREAVAERNRAEEQTALAVRQQEVAERQRSLAEARLNDVHDLADSMLFELNDDVKDLAGGTKARETLVRLGQQYLTKETFSTQGDPRRRQELAEVFIKVGDLQAGPGSNLRDVAGARQSYDRSITALEGEVASHPRDAHLRHLLTLAYVRKARLAESASLARADFQKAERSAEIYAVQRPADPQGLRDRAEVLQAKGDGVAAIDLRQRVLAANPKDPVLRWELAHAEVSLGSSLLPNDKPKSLEWLRRGLDACTALNKEDPSNIQYQRDRAVALRDISRLLQALNKLDEAVIQARLSVSILQQLSASDRLNASIRLDLSDAEIALAEVLHRNSKVAEAFESVARAASIQEEEVARHPDNAEFPRQAANYYRTAAKYKGELKDFKGAVEQYRKAESIDRKLISRYPGNFEFADALRTDVDSIGDSFLSLGDKQSALRAYRDAFEIAKAAASGQNSEESLHGLAEAHRGLAQGLNALSRADEAIAEEREVVAICERQLSGKPDNIDLQRALSFAYKELSVLYEHHGDVRSAVTTSEKALRLVDANYAAHPNNQTARAERWNVLFHLLMQYPAVGEYDRAVAAGRQMVAIAEVSPNLGPFWRDLFLAQSLRDLGIGQLNCGRWEDSLATFHRAISVLDGHPIEKETSLFYRARLADNYLYIVEYLNSARREEESATQLKRLTPVLEAMVHDQPDNNLYRDGLARAYSAASAAYLGLGDLANSLDFEQKGLKLETAPASPFDTYKRILRQVRTGSLQIRLGRPADGKTIWRDAAASLEQLAGDCRRQWSVDKENLSFLETAKLAEAGAAWLQEELGDLRHALRLWEGGMQKEGAVRVRWLIDGQRGDYRAYFATGNPTREEIAHALAVAWRDRAVESDQIGYPHLDAARKALDLDRQSGDRRGLAQSLIVEGDALRAAARESKGPESISAYRNSRQSYTEALEILKLIDERRSLVSLANWLAESGERLSEARNRQALSSK